MKTIHKIDSILQVPLKKPKVAAYCRISKQSERMDHSLSAQISYYNNLIMNNPAWEFAGVYADDSVTGTMIDGRKNFEKMLEDCKNGKIDIILTKSISRFARNTVDLLKTSRMLKELGIDIRFQKEGINTLSESGELMFSLLSSFAQAESESISANIRWFISKSYENGRVLHKKVFGYRNEGGYLVPDETEAAIVHRMFEFFLKGMALRKIKGCIEKEYGLSFAHTQIAAMLKNERYCGDTLLQKTWSQDTINRKRHKNKGERPMYYVENTHPAIISHEIFENVQKELKRRTEEGCFCNSNLKKSFFSGLIKCNVCGRNYVKFIRSGSTRSWGCASRKDKKRKCISLGVNEDILKRHIAKILNMKSFDEEKAKIIIQHIRAAGDGNFTFVLNDGQQINEYINSKSEACKAHCKRIKNTT